LIKQIAIISPRSKSELRLRTLLPLLHEAAKQAGGKVISLRRPQVGEEYTYNDGVRELTAKADLIVLDDTVKQTHDAMLFALGAAQGIGKPTVVVAPVDTKIRYDQYGPMALYRYDIVDTDDDTTKALAELFRQALDDAEAFKAQQKEKAKAAKAFISYSHADDRYLQRLMVHLRPLERRGVLDPWADTRLDAGDLWREELRRAVSEAKAAVLLVSADFLASDFIVDNELPPLLEKAKAEGARIVPVVLSACAYVRDAKLSRFQAVNRAKPLAGLSVAEQEAVWDEVSQEVEKAVGPR